MFKEVLEHCRDMLGAWSPRSTSRHGCGANGLLSVFRCGANGVFGAP